MPQNFTFREQLKDMIGEGVTADAAERLSTTHRITKAGDASKIGDDDARNHVMLVLKAAVSDRLQVALLEMVEEHSTAVGEEFEIIEGECPENPSGAEQWIFKQTDMLIDSFRGEVADALGGHSNIQRALHGGSTPEEFVEALVAGIMEGPDVSEAQNITDGQIKELMNIARQPSATVETKIVDVSIFVTVTREAIDAGLDIMDASDLVLALISSLNEEEFCEHWNVLVPHNTSHDRFLQALDDAATFEPSEFATIADDIIAQAMEPAVIKTPLKVLVSGSRPLVGGAVTVNEKNRDLVKNRSVEPAETAKKKRTRNSDPEPNVYTEACREALTLLVEESNFSETEIADFIGVSRGHMNNYRSGRTQWAPTEEHFIKLFGYVDAIALKFTTMAGTLGALHLK